MFSTAFQANAFQNNAFQVYVAPTPSAKTGGDDASWTREELRRIQRIQQKIAERQRLLEKATKDANASRKQAIRDLVSPVAKVKKTKVQLKSKVNADIPSVDTQELEQIFPGLVEDSPDIERNAAGENVPTGTFTKQVKTTVLIPILVKAMQEQQALIEQLTTRLNALEGK